MTDCDSHVPHPPSVNPSRAILIFCSTCAKTRPSCQLLLLPSATPRHPCCDLQKCKTEQNLRLAEGRKKGGCAASQNRWEEPLYRIARGRGGETPFNADRPRQPVGRSVGRRAKFAEIYSPENRRERIHVLGMRPPARSPVKTAANSKFMTLFGVHNCRRRAASQRHRWLHPALSPILNTYADPEDGGRCRSVGRRQLRSTHSTLLPLLP